MIKAFDFSAVVTVDRTQCGDPDITIFILAHACSDHVVESILRRDAVDVQRDRLGEYPAGYERQKDQVQEAAHTDPKNSA